MTDYPVNLYIKDKLCLVVGGGAVAERKAKTLLQAGATVKLVSPKVTLALAKLVQGEKLTVMKRPFCPDDLQGCFLVICATDDDLLNQRVVKESQAAGVLINVVDQPYLGNFSIPAQLSRKDLLFTVSTGGKSPAFASLMRQNLTDRYGPEYGEYLDFFAKMRELVKEKVMSVHERAGIWQSLSQELLILLQAGKFDEAEEKIQDAIGRIRA